VANEDGSSAGAAASSRARALTGRPNLSSVVNLKSMERVTAAALVGSGRKGDLQDDRRQGGLSGMPKESTTQEGGWMSSTTNQYCVVASWH
jgi:hypothetical protein